MCLWSIQVAAREHILLEFLEFDLENDTQCHSDHLTVYVDEDRRIGGRNYGFVVVLPSASGCEVPCFLLTLFNRSILWWSTSISDSYWWFPQYHSAVCVWCKQHRWRICHPIQWCWQGLQFWWVESVECVALVWFLLLLCTQLWKAYSTKFLESDTIMLAEIWRFKPVWWQYNNNAEYVVQLYSIVLITMHCMDAWNNMLAYCVLD